MTRINSAVSVKSLTDQHLLAEHREIKRICQNYLTCRRVPPTKFTLGAGHVLFFVNKPAFTYKRYIAIYNECLRRNLNVQDWSSNWHVYDSKDLSDFDYDYMPTYAEFELLKQRISERLMYGKVSWTYYRNKISVDDAIAMLSFDTLL